MTVSLRTDRIYRSLPRGYRWATSDETERILGYGAPVVDVIQVAQGGEPGDWLTDLAVPMHPLDAVDESGHLICPFCEVDVEMHDAVHYNEDCFK